MIPYAQLQAIVSAVMGFAGWSSIALRDSSNFPANSSGESRTRTIANYLNPAAVEIPTDRSQPFGNAPRNVARGPGFAQFDLDLHKAFGRDSTRLGLHFEAFNRFNCSNFGTPNANRSNANYGTITSTSAARQIQAGVKVHF